MAERQRTVAILTSLPVRELDDDWVKNVLDNDFTDTDPLPIHIEESLQEENYHCKTLHQCKSQLQHWAVEGETENGEGFWTVLVENDIPHRNLVVLFAYLMEIGNKRTASSCKKEAAILAGSCYLSLISISGSGAFKIFHPALFERSVDILKSWTIMESVGKRKKHPSGGGASQKGKKSRKSKPQEMSQISENFDVDEEEEDVQEMTPQDMKNLKKNMTSLLIDLVEFLEVYSLRQAETSACHTAQVLIEVMKMEPEMFDGRFSIEKLQMRYASLSSLAFRGMYLLCTSLHGHIVSLTTALFKYLLPGLLMLVGPNKAVAQTIPRSLHQISDHSLHFVTFLLKECGESIYHVTRTLMQHMCTKVPDKADYRTKVTQAVITIMSKLPDAAYAKMVEWIHRLSKTAAVNNRGIAIELVLLLLSKPERDITESIPEDLIACTKHTALMEILLERCSDIAPSKSEEFLRAWEAYFSVRARALSSFSQCLTSSDCQIKGAIKELVTPVNTAVRPNGPRLIPTPSVESRASSRADDSTVICLNKQAAGTDGQNSPSITTATETVTPNQTTDETPSTIPLPENATGSSTAVNSINTENQTARQSRGITPFITVKFTPGFDPNISDDSGVVSMIRRRAQDEKVHVRKAALQALENTIRFEAPNYRKADLDILEERCRDPALSVKKQALQSLSDLLQEYPRDAQIQCAWIEGAFQLVYDKETSLQEKCIELVENVMLDNIVPYHRSKDDSHALVWDILDRLSMPKSDPLRRYLRKFCEFWALQKKFKASTISSLQSHIDTENNKGAWLLLSEVAHAVPKLQSDKLIEYWEKNSAEIRESTYQTFNHVLTVLGYAAKHIPKEKAETLIADLNGRLLRFDSPPELIQVIVSTLSKLCEAQVAEGSNKAEKEAWCVSLLKASDEYLSSIILETGTVEYNEEKVICHLFTLGEVAQLCPAKIPKRVDMLVQSVIATPCITDLESSNCSDKTSQSSHSHLSDPGAPPSSQPSEPPLSQGTQLSQPLSQFRGSKMSSRVRAFAFITLGKLCLQNERLAKKFIAAFARELEVSTDMCIRNNVIIVMCDLCIRYTTLVDRYVPNIAACLKDDAPLVRMQTVVLLTRLLQEDFLRWKGVLFFRYIFMLLDEYKEIADFAEYCFIHRLIHRHPLMFFQHFVECIFHFNQYESHSVYNKFSQNDREKKLFTLKGSQNANKRKKLYSFMLENMIDEHRFKLTAKIVQEILANVVDGLMPLNSETSDLIQDALIILSSKEIKLSSLKAKPTDDIVEEQEMAAAVIATAKKNIITQVVKRNVIENIVPIVISLKQMLEKKRSPLQRYLMRYLAELLKDFKNEVQEILAADKQLATEIEFDLRKFEEHEKSLAEDDTRAEQQKEKSANAPSKTGSANASPVQMGSRRNSVASAGNSPRPTSSPTQHASPKPVSSPVQNTSPKPGSSPAQRATPQQRSPQVNAGKSPSSQIGTPMRNASLSTVAILNSARKAVEKVKEMRKLRDTPVKTPKKLASPSDEFLSLDDNVENDIVAELNDSIRNSRTPALNRKAQRAISTPSVALANITFHADHNITMIPPSPIPTSVPLRVYSSDASSVSPKDLQDQQRKTLSSKQVVFMFSPDKPLPKPEKWNVQSALVNNDSSTNQSRTAEKSGTRSSARKQIISTESNSSGVVRRSGRRSSKS